MESTRENSWL